MPYFSLFLNDTIHDIAFLGDPTDVYVVPEKASHAAKAAYGSGLRNFGLDMLVNLFSNGKYMNKNTVPVGKFISNGSTNEMDENRQTVHLTNGLTKEHGANHALAKHIQHWRSIIEYEAGTTGRPLPRSLFVYRLSTHNNHNNHSYSLHRSSRLFIASIHLVYSFHSHILPIPYMTIYITSVSASVAPITGTVFALSNIYNNYSFGGLSYFGIEVFKQETTISVMTAILIHDVLNSKSPKNPKNRIKNHVRTGWDLFGIQAVHGGIWRSPYKAGSILGEFALMSYFVVEGCLSFSTTHPSLTYLINTHFYALIHILILSSYQPLLVHTLTPPHIPSHPSPFPFQPSSTGAIIGGMSVLVIIGILFFIQMTQGIGPKLPSGMKK